jgi:Xaa-Pro dipeptidase
VPLHFTREEFAQRRQRACAALADAGLDGVVLFRQESLYWLTGYDSFGYVYFQCGWLGADGRMALLVRVPDLRQARYTSLVDDVRTWTDGDGARPEAALRDLLAGYGAAGMRVGVEYDAYGLTAAGGRRLDAALDGFCRAEDASGLVTRLRLVKSAAEIACAREAAGHADAALAAALPLLRPGTFEGDLFAAMHGAVYRRGGDDPANEFIIGSGPAALLSRYQTGRRTLGADDQVTLEFAGVARHYHACLMRTYKVGTPPLARQRDLHAVALDALAACEARARPGATFGAVFEAYRATCDAAGMAAHRYAACGYSLGATFAPNWMDWPMFYAGNPVVLAPGMVVFLHMILMDSDAGVAACPGRTVLVTEGGCEPLSAMPLTLTPEEALP